MSDLIQKLPLPLRAFVQAATVLGVSIAAYGWLAALVANHDNFVMKYGWRTAGAVLTLCILWAVLQPWAASTIMGLLALRRAIHSLKDATKRNPDIGRRAMQYAKAQWLISQDDGLFTVISFDVQTNTAVLSSSHIDYREGRDLSEIGFVILDEYREEKGKGTLLRCSKTEMMIRVSVQSTPPCAGDMALPVLPKVNDLEKAIAGILLGSEF